MKMLQTLLLPSTARRVRRERLTYLSPEKLRSLIAAIRTLNREGVAGDVLEMGVALGGSGILLASLMGERAFYGYDVFGLIPPPGKSDSEDAHRRFAKIEKGESRGSKGDLYYGYREDLLCEVRENFRRFGYPEDKTRVHLIEGLFEDTLPLEGPAVALAHIDCDWHDPVKLCIERTGPRISAGGLIILDDYNDYEGCKKATKAFLEKAPFDVVTLKPHAILRRR